MDGTYTVLAKVVGPVVDDEPVLSRNKLLERVHPAAVDYGARQLNSLVEDQMAKISTVLPSSESDNQWQDLQGDGVGTPEVSDDDPSVFDFHSESRVPGASLRVIPIAIFI